MQADFTGKIRRKLGITIYRHNQLAKNGNISKKRRLSLKESPVFTLSPSARRKGASALGRPAAVRPLCRGPSRGPGRSSPAGTAGEIREFRLCQQPYAPTTLGDPGPKICSTERPCPGRCSTDQTPQDLVERTAAPDQRPRFWSTETAAADQRPRFWSTERPCGRSPEGAPQETGRKEVLHAENRD